MNKHIVALLFVLCSQAHGENTEIQKILKEFLRDKEKYSEIVSFSPPPENIIIRLDKVISGWEGYCTEDENGLPKIVLSRQRWENNLSQQDRKAILYHELGHCLLNLDHSDGIMAPSTGERDLTEENIKNLFNKPMKGQPQ